MAHDTARAQAAGPQRTTSGPRLAAGGAAAVGVLWLLRVVTAGALAVDAYVHADLAQSYDPVRADISQGTLFRIEAGAAALAALLPIAAGRRLWVWAPAFAVAAAGLAAVLVYRYIDIGAFGPFPSMYEPVWFTEKTVSAVAEAVATATALAGLVLAYLMISPARRPALLPSRRRARHGDAPPR